MPESAKFVCIDDGDHGAVEDVRGIFGLEEVIEAYKNSDPEQLGKSRWHERVCDNGGPTGL